MRQAGEEAYLYALWPSRQGNGRAEACGGLGEGWTESLYHSPGMQGMRTLALLTNNSKELK